MKHVVVPYLIVGLLAASGCMNKEDTVNTLTKSGMTTVKDMHAVFFGCGNGDLYRTGFIATNPKGAEVSGIVCCGWLKSCTVRW